MPLSEAKLRDVQQRLDQVSPALNEAFQESLTRLPADLSDEKLNAWVDEGMELADPAIKSWECAADYFRISPDFLASLDDSSFRAWARSGRRLAELSGSIASSYFRASPEVMPLIAGAQVREWAYVGERLHKSTWKSIALAGDFFSISPLLLANLTIPDLARFGRVLEGISDRSADLAAACLDAFPEVVTALNQAERLAFLDFASAISDAAWPEASLYFQRGPELLRPIHDDHRAAFLEVAARVARRLGREAYSLFAEGANALKNVDLLYHGQLIKMADRLIGISPVAAMSFLKSSPEIAGKLRVEEVEAWHEAGLEILRESIEGGEAYFRLESGRAEQLLNFLSARVDLYSVSELLRLYGKALTGTNISVQPVSALEEKGIGWVREGGATTEGTAIFLPDFIHLFDTKDANFGVIKVYATHQTAHLEFGSFGFSFARRGGVMRRRRHLVERERRAEGLVTKRRWVTDMERFFDLFPERQMGSDIFTLVEDLRIDSQVRSEYGGIRAASRRVQESELEKRPEVRSLPLREGLIENLVRVSLDGSKLEWPRALQHLLGRAIATLNRARAEEATVEDAAEVTLALYDIAALVPNLPPEALQDLDWDSLSEEDLEKLAQEWEDYLEGLEDLPDDEEEMDYNSPGDVDFRGDFKPEMVQLLERMRNDEKKDEDDAEKAELTPEQIKELLEKSVEVDMEDEESMSDFIENLEKEAGQSLQYEDPPEDQEVQTMPPTETSQAVEVKTFFYDEWDFRAGDYRPRWCAVRERHIEEGTEEYYEKVMRENAALVNETQRQFELLKPETFRKIKKLEDGEDLDLDAVIDFIVQKKAGHGDNPKVYWRRNKVERDVAVAFLLDMSASTDEEIDKHRRREGAQDNNDPRRYASVLSQGRSPLVEPPKRIIDLERESIVLLTRALEAIGDRYGIFGFSGYGRENIEYYVIKDLEEAFSDTIRRRIDKVTPIRSTRMGPAIRHTTTKLMKSEAKARILFMVSDGRPQDHGYGRDRTEKEYAIHDTHKAFQEAKHKGIIPFALTVDKEGHDYLGQMCGDMAYEVLDNIELLPARLPSLYRRLTE
ncbi:MAG: VWA domain-containing protein [Dehalococcoidia bacterium]|nr:VWA domain-containing protein [Dehalococcoidia bacterium]